MGIQRSLVAILASIQHRAFNQATKHIETAFSKNWQATYEYLKNSPYWQGKLQANLNDNPVTTYNDYQVVFDS